MNYRKLLIVSLLLTGSAFAQAQSAAADTSVSVAENGDAAVTAADSGKAEGAAVAVSEDSAAADTPDSSSAQPAARVLDLDRLLTEEDEDDLLAGDEPAVVSEPADSGAVDLSAAADSLLADSTLAGSAPADPVPKETAPEAVSATTRRGAPPEIVQADDGPAVIVDGRTVNFAQNLKEYKSPRLAMLLSLLVPGLGQAYARNYGKAAAFGAVEVVAIGTAAYLNSVGTSKKRDARRFADEHFDIDQFNTYRDQLKEEFERREADMELFPYDTVFDNAAINRTSYYYESIRGYHFTQGWRDSDSALFLENILSLGPSDTLTGRNGRYVLFDPDSAYPHHFYLIVRVVDNAGNAIRGGSAVTGYSSYQARYNSMVKDANAYHDAVNYTLYALVINHIVSAIDAGFTAQAHNRRLLGRDESAWDRLSIEQQYVFTGSEMSSGVALRFRF